MFYGKIDNEIEKIEEYIKKKLELLKDIFARQERIKEKGISSIGNLLNKSSVEINNEIKIFKAFKHGWKKAFMEKNIPEIFENLNQQVYESQKEKNTLDNLNGLLEVVKEEINFIEKRIKKFQKNNVKNLKRLQKIKKNFKR